MDFYSYYKERFTWGPNPYVSVAQCQQTVTEMMDNPRIPFRVASESAISFLAALADFAGDGCTVTTTYKTVMNALTFQMDQTGELAGARDRAWRLELLETERADGEGPAYDPGEYTVWPVDLEGENPDDEPGLDEPDFANLEDLYGMNGEPGSTGTRRPFPDWQHIDKWTQEDWIKLQTFKDKILAASDHGFLAIGSVANVLAAAKDAMHHIPLPRQVELALWAEEIVDRLIFSLEDSLGEMCAGSLHSHQGRLVQKQMFFATTGQTQG